METGEIIKILITHGVIGGFATGTLLHFAGYLITSAVSLFRNITGAR